MLETDFSQSLCVPSVFSLSFFSPVLEADSQQHFAFIVALSLHLSHQHKSFHVLCTVIKVILIQKLNFPHPSPIIIFEAYFKCRVINHVTVEAPLGLRACWEIFPFISSRLLFISSHLKSTSHKLNCLAFVVLTDETSSLHNKLL